MSSVQPYQNTNKQVIEPTIVSTLGSGMRGDPSICLTDDGKAWVGGYNSSDLRLLESDGNIVRTRRPTSKPICLAMNSSEDIILSPYGGDRTVMKLGKDGTESSLLDISPSFCHGVSVSQDGDILVCTTDGRVLRANGDGENVKLIYNGKKELSAVHAIELPDGNICVSDYANKALVIIDKEGQVIRQMVPPTGAEDYLPWGLVCDSVGNILSADNKNDYVYMVSQTGEFRELVGASHGISLPCWLAVDRDDQLWITQTDGEIIVVRYLA